MKRAFPVSAPASNPIEAKRTDAGWAGCSFRYVEVPKTRRKQDHRHPEVIQFKPVVFRPFLSAFPEFRGLDDPLARARRGLKVLRRTRDTIEALIPRIGDYPPASPKRLNLFMSILAELMESGELAVAGGPALLPMRRGRMDEKLDLACRLMQSNLVNPLYQAYMAEQWPCPRRLPPLVQRHMGKCVGPTREGVAGCPHRGRPGGDFRGGGSLPGRIRLRGPAYRLLERLGRAALCPSFRERGGRSGT